MLLSPIVRFFSLPKMPANLMNLLFMAIFLLQGCSNGTHINGNSLKSASRSVSIIKERLPAEKKLSFEAAFWVLHEQIGNQKDFLEVINGKDPDQLIELGKSAFARGKQAGFKSYQPFYSWEQMLSHYAELRSQQDNRAKSDGRDGKYPYTVLYKL